MREKDHPTSRSSKWHHSATLAGNQNGRTHYDIGGDDNSNVALVFPSEYGDEDTLRNARQIAAAPETAAERDRLKELNGELLDALKGALSQIDYDEFNCDSADYRYAKEVIAKAEGF